MFSNIAAFTFVLGVLIFVHELGHFLMARRIGVRVLTFSLGFGPKILSIRRGDTEYCISAIPLGGYVKMAGETAEDARTGAPDEFLSKTKWQRFQVLIMGPVMNLILALIVMTFVLYQGADVPTFGDQPVVVGSVVPDSPAAKVGIQAGDRILAIGDVTVANWDDFATEILPRGGKPVKLTIERGGRRFQQDLTLGADGPYEAGFVGMRAVTRPAVAAVNPGEPAHAAGIRRGDVILAVNGEKPIAPHRITEVIQANEGKPVTFEIERDGRSQTVTATPKKLDTVRIGIQITAEFKTVQPTFLEAFKLSAERNWEAGTLILRTLAGLFTRETKVNALMGPIGIAGVSGDAFQLGWLPLFSLMAMISLNLGLLNLMPVPVLDGGHIAILALEGLSRRDFSIRVKEKMLLAGFVLLLMLMVTVIYNDLTRVQWIERLMPWR